MPTLIENPVAWANGSKVRFNFLPFMDGKPYSYVAGTDFASKPVSFVQSAGTAGKKYNKQVMTKILPDHSAVLIQFVDKPAEVADATPAVAAEPVAEATDAN